MLNPSVCPVLALANTTAPPPPSSAGAAYAKTDHNQRFCKRSPYPFGRTPCVGPSTVLQRPVALSNRCCALAAILRTRAVVIRVGRLQSARDNVGRKWALFHGALGAARASIRAFTVVSPHSCLGSRKICAITERRRVA
jgi:hypothetical protein